jgi:hypothetical protein
VKKSRQGREDTFPQIDVFKFHFRRAFQMKKSEVKISRFCLFKSIYSEGQLKYSFTNIFHKALNFNIDTEKVFEPIFGVEIYIYI